VEKLASIASMSVSSFHRHFKAVTGSQFSREYAREFGLPPARDVAGLRAA
jgi:AraC-like DNA-binding protein